LRLRNRTRIIFLLNHLALTILAACLTEQKSKSSLRVQPDICKNFAPSKSELLRRFINFRIHSGGSVLAALLAANSNSQYSFSALIRDSKQAEKLENLGVRTILFGGLDDVETCEREGGEHDGM
jgi:hypothetical protein